MRLLPSIAAALALAPAFVSAQETSEPRSLPPIGWTISLGGGVQDFTETRARDETSTGGAWDVRLGAGAQRIVGVEVAYVGSAQNINTLGLSSDATLVSHGVEGDIRVAVPTPVVSPYAFAGAAWRHYTVHSDQNTSDIGDSDSVIEIPVGAGLMSQLGPVIIDARFTFRPSFQNDLFGESRLHNWAATANAGWQF